MLYSYVTLPITSREEYNMLWVFKNKILRRIIGPKGDESSEWRRFNKEELHSFCPSSNIFRVNKCERLRWAGHVTIKEKGRSYFFF